MTDSAADHTAADPGTKPDLFIVRLLQAAYGYGSSVFRLEAALPLVAKGQGVQAEMMVTGPAGQFVFWDDSIENQRSYLVRMPNPDPDLTKAIDIGDLAVRASEGSLTSGEATAELELIQARPQRFGLVPLLAAFGLIGAGVAVMFATQWSDVVVGFAAGMLAFAMILLGMRLPWLGGSLDFFTGLAAAFIFTGVATVIEGSNPFVMTICAVAVYIPGFLLSQGVTELVMGYTVSGIGRIVAATMVTLKLFAGAVIGTAAGYWLFGEPAPPANADVTLPLLFVFIAILLVGVAIVFQNRPQDFIWVILCGLVTYAALTAGNQAGVWQGALAGGLAVGLFANIWARLQHLPSNVTKLPAVMVLMPGVVAYIGIFDAAGEAGLDALLGATGTILQTVLAMIVGLIVANTLVRPWVPAAD
jgi:uncharacterized membrane protein YjjP (DUF1212 family)